MTAALNLPQKTNRGVTIVWTDRRHGLHNDVLDGHIIGKRGQPLAGFVFARVQADGSVGVVKDHRGAIVG